jgi:hypothetical protein
MEEMIRWLGAKREEGKGNYPCGSANLAEGGLEIYRLADIPFQQHTSSPYLTWQSLDYVFTL